MESLLDTLALTSPLELIAVILALAYLVLAARQSQWCWLAAFISCALYVQLMFAARLYLETLLQFCYVILAVYGWWQWQYGAGRSATEQGDIGRPQFSLWWHVRAIGLTSTVATLVALLAARYTDAEAVWLDSFTTVFSLFATWLLTRKAIENWWYWLVIDTAYIYLYLSKGFTATAGLFALYVLLVIYAIFQWRRQQSAPLTSIQDETKKCRQSG